MEEVVAGIWARILGLDAGTFVGRHADFFALGGHSLLATQAVARLRAALGAAGENLPLRWLFDHPTPAALAPHMEALLQQRAVGQSNEAPVIPPLAAVVRPPGAPLQVPVSYAQERLWVVEQLIPDTAAYHLPAALRLRGALDIDALREALGALVARHESLRTAFVALDGQPMQLVAPPPDPAALAQAWPLPLVDLSGDEANVDARLTTLAQEVATTPFPLDRAPLVRAVLAHLGPQEHVLVLVAHHLIIDGWSIGLLVRDLAALYTAAHGGLRGEVLLASLPVLPLQYADFSVWQRNTPGPLDGPALDRLLAYWRTALGAPTLRDDADSEGRSGRTEWQLPLLALPADRPRPSVQSGRGGTVPVRVPASLVHPLRALAREEGATLYMALLASYQLLLHRLTAQQEIFVGTPVAGRTHPATEDIVGCFVNTLVLRASFSNSPDTYRALLRRTREACLGAYTHQDLPFELLVEALHPTRRLHASPLFQALLTLQNTPTSSSLTLPQLGLESLPLTTGGAQFDLSLSLAEGAARTNAAESTTGNLSGSLEYAADLFDHSTAERFVAQLLTLLEGCVASPDAPLATLPLLPDDEARLVRDVFPHGRLPETLPQPNITAAAHIVPEGALLHELFLAQVARTPEAVALIWPGDEVPSTTDATSSDPPATLTYRDLQASAQRLAHALSANGVRQGDLVGLCTPRSPSMVAGVLGILLAGAAYVPLDPSYPSARLAYLLDDARPRVLLAHRAAASQLPPLPSGTSLLWLDDLLASSPLDVVSPPEDSPHFALPSDPERDQRIAYVIYTSGSTGLPKGVAVSHRSVVHLARALVGAYALTPADRVLQFAAIGFDVFAEELFPTLAAGAVVVLAPSTRVLAVSEFAAFASDQKLTVLNLPTPYWHAWADALPPLTAPAPADAQLEDDLPSPATVRLMVIGSDRADPRLVLRWQCFHAANASATGRPAPLLLNAYGVTEATVTSLLHDIPLSLVAHEPGLTPAEVPVGRPLLGVEAYVLDQELRPCPIGMPGELYIGGPGIARGYLRRPALTAERFVPHPFSTLPGARLYKTGDRARWLPDGNLEYLGRLDRQVKIRGHRIELGEVEATLRHLPGVADAAVIATPGPGSAPEDASPSSDLRLVAYVAPSHPGPVSSDETLTPDSLRSGLAHNMPAYLLPAAIIILDSLPLTPNGKLDRNALPPPDWTRLPTLSTNHHQPPRTEMEKVIANIWTSVLGVDVQQISTKDSFFELGGHSLALLRAHGQLQKTLHREIKVTDLFHVPTIEQLAQYLESMASAAPTRLRGQDRGAMQRQALVLRRRPRNEGTR